MRFCKVCRAVALLAAAGSLITSAIAANEFVAVKRVVALGASGNSTDVVPPRSLGPIDADVSATVNVGAVDPDPSRFTVVHSFDPSTSQGAPAIQSMGDFTIFASTEAVVM